jgi:PAS domain S-box-containing protein
MSKRIRGGVTELRDLPQRIRQLTIWAGVAWSLVVFGLLWADVRHARSVTMTLTTEEAVANFNWDHALRAWSASHGGVWVPTDERTPPNPYLTEMLTKLGKAEEQNLTTPLGRKLTLMNPAYLFRQMVSEYELKNDVKGHLTSLDLIRPENAPDPWERKALERFEKGETQVMEVSEIGGKPYLRLMRPEYITEGCLPCHKAQGYAIGDVRGGISVSTPMDAAYARENEEILFQAVSHGVIWLFGMFLIFGGGRSLTRHVEGRIGAEERLLRLAAGVEGSADAVYITDADGAILYVNPSFERITGYADDEVVGMNPSLLKSDRQDPEVYREMWAAAVAGRSWRGVVTNRSKAGSHYDAEVTVAPVFDDKGGLTGFVGTQRDVSREVALTRARDYFTAVTSHEIRTPLTKLGMALAVMEGRSEEAFDETLMDRLKMALRESYDELERISSAALLLSRLNIMRTAPPSEPVSVAEIVVLAVAEAREGAEKVRRRITIATDLDRLPEGATSPVNRDLMVRAMGEVLSNAIKYTPDDGVVRVAAVREESAFLITVDDEGPGIPPDMVEQAMEPYSSLEETRTHTTGRYKFRGGGLGLGLTVARMVADYHRGDFSITPRAEGSGTRATFTLPLI